VVAVFGNCAGVGPAAANVAGFAPLYFWRKEQDQILMLVAYPKSRKNNLTVKEATVLRDLVKEL